MESVKTKLETDIAEITGCLAEVENGRNTAMNELANVKKLLLSTANHVMDMERKLEEADRRVSKAEQKLIAFDAYTNGNSAVNGDAVDEEIASICDRTIGKEISADHESESKDKDKVEPSPCCVKAVEYVLYQYHRRKLRREIWVNKRKLSAQIFYWMEKGIVLSPVLKLGFN